MSSATLFRSEEKTFLIIHNCIEGMNPVTYLPLLWLIGVINIYIDGYLTGPQYYFFSSWSSYPIRPRSPLFAV